MRKLLAVAVATAALLIVSPVTTGWAASSHNQAVGEGALDQFGDPTARVNANQTRSGVKGSFTITYPDGTFVQGKPTCLSVSGNTAFVTGRITESSGPRQVPNAWLPGSFLVIGVQDNAGSVDAAPDLLNFSTGFAADPGCGPNGAAVPVLPIVAGDYRVTNAV
jgi:hypothetical protein